MMNHRQESDERRKARLSRRRECKREAHASKSAEEREAQLARQRVSDRARRAVHSTDERERTLQQRRQQLSQESSEEREARLQAMRQRLDSETPEERGPPSANEAPVATDWVLRLQRTQKQDINEKENVTEDKEM